MPRKLWVIVAVVVAMGASAAGGWALGNRTSRSQSAAAASAVDIGFLRDMSDHHDQAVQLALFELRGGGSEVLRGFATDVLASQRYEIGLMDARLEVLGHDRGSPQRQAMAWMGHPTPVASMPGMATREELAAFAAARGAAADELFVRLMVDHHEGGIHMAEHAWKHAEDPKVRVLAERIAKEQRLEVRDLLRIGEGLGLRPDPTGN